MVVRSKADGQRPVEVNAAMSLPREAPLSAALLGRMDAYWRAANFLSVGQIYLYDNPLLRRPLALSDVKPLVVGHWGTTPGQNFIYVHLNRVIKKYDLDMFYVAGPGHGGPALVGNTYLEGSYSEVYPDVSQDEAGMKRLFKQFSFPGGISSHVAPTTPGSIHEGGELGYSLSHAFGAAFDNPDLIVACVVGDGEAETGPLATSWQSNKFLDPVSDGAVLPILHLNGYKISNPTVLARIEPNELDQFLRGCGWDPLFVEGDAPEEMHQLMAGALEEAIEGIRQIQGDARASGDAGRPRWPMVVLRSPKGWTGPKVVDGLQVEGTFRSHQVPLLVDAEHPDDADRTGQRPSGSARARPSGTSAATSARLVTNNPIRSRRRRRATNASTLSEAGSSHCTSSMPTSNGRSRDSTASTRSVARATARCKGRCPSGSLSTSATSRARRCGSGSSAIASPKSSANRSPSAVYASSDSASIGRQHSTRYERSAAAARPAFHSEVFPIPASPSRSNATGPSSIAPRNPPKLRSSAFRPMIDCGSSNTARPPRRLSIADAATRLLREA